MEVKTTWH